MCTLLVGVDRPRAGMLMLGANRDESLARPSMPPHVIVRQPRIVAGRDSRAGGTWLGVNEHGVLVAVTNRRKTNVPMPARSRGLLTREALSVTFAG